MSIRTQPGKRRSWRLHDRQSMINSVIGILLAWHGFQAWPNSVKAQSLHFTRLQGTTLTCAQAQSSVQEELKKRGFFSPYKAFAGTQRKRIIYPTMTLDSTSIEKYFYGAPPGRPQQLDINLSGDFDKLYYGLLSSPVYLSSLGARIMESCSDIGLVGFNHWHEGWVPVGFFPDGTARIFRRIERRDAPHTRLVSGEDGINVLQYEWGYYFSL